MSWPTNPLLEPAGVINGYAFTNGRFVEARVAPDVADDVDEVTFRSGESYYEKLAAIPPHARVDARKGWRDLMGHVKEEAKCRARTRSYDMAGANVETLLRVPVPSYAARGERVGTAADVENKRRVETKRALDEMERQLRDLGDGVLAGPSLETSVEEFIALVNEAQAAPEASPELPSTENAASFTHDLYVEDSSVRDSIGSNVAMPAQNGEAAEELRRLKRENEILRARVAAMSTTKEQNGARKARKGAKRAPPRVRKRSMMVEHLSNGTKTGSMSNIASARFMSSLRSATVRQTHALPNARGVNAKWNPNVVDGRSALQGNVSYYERSANAVSSGRGRLRRQKSDQVAGAWARSIKDPERTAAMVESFGGRVRTKGTGKNIRPMNPVLWQNPDAFGASAVVCPSPSRQNINQAQIAVMEDFLIRSKLGLVNKKKFAKLRREVRNIKRVKLRGEDTTRVYCTHDMPSADGSRSTWNTSPIK